MKLKHIFIALLKKLISGRNVSINVKSRMSMSTILKVEGNGRISIKKGFHSMRNTTLHVVNGEILIGENTFLNENTNIVAHSKISIGDNVTIGPNVTIYDHDHDLHNRGGFVSKPISIADNVWIGANAIILKGASLGENAVIAAGAIVTKDVPANHLVRSKIVCEMMEYTFKGDVDENK